MDLDQVAVPGLLPAVLAAAACLLAFRPPQAGLYRITVPPASLATKGGSALAHAVRGRAGAPPLARRVVLGAGAGGGACLVVSRLLDLGWWPFLGWPVVAATAVVLLGQAEPQSAQVRARRLVAEVPQALELMADGLAVGLPLRGACAAVVDAFGGPVAEELGSVLRAVELGVGDATAWRGLAGHPQLGPAATDVARAAESGAELVAALRRQAAAARERRRTALQQRARSVGVRSVLPLMTCFIPAFLLLGVVPTVVSAVAHAFG